MIINYKLADGSIYHWEVSEEVGQAYLDILEAEKRINRKESRRHSSLNGFKYEDSRYFSSSTDICDEIAVSDAVKSVLDRLTDRERYLLIKVCVWGYSYSEIARAENKHPSTIMRWTNKARDKFKRFYAEDCNFMQNPLSSVA